MGKAVDFGELWRNHQENRKVGAFAWSEKPTQNRCAFVLGLTLKAAFKPRLDQGELSFRSVESLPKALRRQPFMDKFYVKAADLAARLREEWGKPDIKSVGSNAALVLRNRQGVIFIENAWRTKFGLGDKTVDHVDLWDGERLGAYPAAESTEILARADSVWLWLVPRIKLPQ
jgi:hypothetical protein